MKVCVTSEGKTLYSAVDPRFGRCQYFIIIDTETMDCETIENPNIFATGGAGIQSGRFMLEKQVKAVLTGNVGPNAFQTLQAAGIDIITGASGMVKDVIDRFKKGELNATQNPTVNEKFGMPGKNK